MQYSHKVKTKHRKTQNKQQNKTQKEGKTFLKYILEFISNRNSRNTYQALRDSLTSLWQETELYTPDVHLYSILPWTHRLFPSPVHQSFNYSRWMRLFGLEKRRLNDSLLSTVIWKDVVVSWELSSSAMFQVKGWEEMVSSCAGGGLD